MKFLFGSLAHNEHVLQIAQSLYEAGVLGAFYTGGVDVWKSPTARSLRSLLSRNLDPKLERRRSNHVPESLVYPHWLWESGSLMARAINLELIQDWFWENSELSLDRTCARNLESREFDGFIGTEFGALTSITRARKAHKPAVVVFLSPHHRVRALTVDQEYERFPELLSPTARKLLQLGIRRDARRDEELSASHIVVTNSRFTADSIAASGVPKSKILTVPLGCPPVRPNSARRNGKNASVKFLYSGPVSVRKGAHYLIQAWKQLAVTAGAELHFYGSVHLPKASIIALPGMHFHGHVSSEELSRAYEQADCLVFPTLCDGFGLVVGEALAHGVPVLTTTNAGASDLIRPYRNGLIVPPFDADALTQGMQWMIENRALWPQMREEASQTALGWTWEDFRRKLWCDLSAAVSNLSQTMLVV